MNYGIQHGQIYKSADGTGLTLKVIDCETYADVYDVVVERPDGYRYRIDSFKLARVRYILEEGG